METIEAYDLGTLYAFGGLHRDWLDPIVEGVSRLGNAWVIGPFAAGLMVVFLLLGQRRYALGFAIVCLAAWGLEWVVKLLVARPRPDVVWRLLELPTMPGIFGFLHLGSIQPSFPSGHALNSMSICTLAGILFGRLIGRPWLGIVGVAISVVIGLTRPYLGMHYPIDVLAGWLAGLGCALVGAAVIGPPEPPRPLRASGTIAAPPPA
jgi:undecaprenyl-diphosphatase